MIPMPKKQQAQDELRSEFFDFLNYKLDQIEKNDSMNTLDNIAKTIFQSRPEILGQMALMLIKRKYSELLNQEFCNCPCCDKRLKAMPNKVRREIETLIGPIELHRPYFYCKTCKKGYYPLDDALELSSGIKQYDIQELEAWMACELPYENVSETLKRSTGITTSAHHIHETTNSIAENIGALDVCPSKEEIENQIKKLSEGKFRRPVMMLGIDGSHAPTRQEPSKRDEKRGKGEWKEVKGFRIYLINGKRIIHLISWHQIQEDKELADALSKIKEAGLIPEDKVRLCVIGDGAPWIKNRTEEIFPKAKFVLDYYHCSEYLNDLAHAQYGKNSQEAQEWVEAKLTLLFCNEIDTVLNEIKEMKPSSENAEEEIKGTLRYLSKRKDQVDYGATKRGGYHIGSGAIESSNKFISNVRLKRSGAWWYPTNANNILKLRCAKYNGTYDRLIEQYKREERRKTQYNKNSSKFELGIGSK